MELLHQSVMLPILGIIGVFLVPCTIGSQAMELKTTSDYDWIYDDRGTGADSDVSIWRPRVNIGGYCALGDVAHGGSHGMPSAQVRMVKPLIAGALTHPTGFTEIWNDRGSGGDFDVRIMQMHAPAGYRCLGYVAVLGYNLVPNTSDYCCVQEGYLTQGDLAMVWKDSGSGANSDVSFWKVTTTGDYGVDTGTFLAVAHHGRPEETSYQLDFMKVFLGI